jgi:hypothetical protein
LKTGIVKYGGRSTYVARKIDEWMDGVIKDPNHGGYSIEFGNAEHLAPNHSFRHYLKYSYSTAMFPNGFPMRSPATRHRASGANMNMWKCGKNSTRSASCR